MNEARDPFLAFLAQVRRQLWVQAASRHLTTALGSSAGTCAALALVHLLVLPLAPTTGILSAASVLLAVFAAQTIRGRPTQADAARAADRWFETEELFVSALDQAERPAAMRSPAAALVVARARRFSEETRPGLPRPKFPSRPWWFLAFAALAAASLATLPLKGGRLLRGAASPSGVPPLASVPASTSGERLARALGEAFASSKESPLPRARPPKAGPRGKERGGPLVDAESGEKSAAQRRDANSGVLASARSRSPSGKPGESAPPGGVPGPGRGKEAGSAGAGGAATPPAALARSVDFRFVDVLDAVPSRGGEPGGDGPAFVEAGSPEIVASGRAAEAARASPSPSLTPILRLYVSRYLQRAGATNATP